jgi:nitroreductase
VQGDARGALAALLSQTYIATNAAQAADQTQKMAARIEEVFSVPPLIVFVVSRTDPQSRIPELEQILEQILSAGAACMNLLTAATALGFGANWLTGWAAYSAQARAVIGLEEHERIAGFIPIGTRHGVPIDRQRPTLDAIMMPWRAPPARL